MYDVEAAVDAVRMCDVCLRLVVKTKTLCTKRSLQKVPSKSGFGAVTCNLLNWFRAVQVILIRRDHSMAMSATTAGGLLAERESEVS